MHPDLEAGGFVDVQEPFPGTKIYPGWLFLYIQSFSLDEFLRMFDEIGDYIEKEVQSVPDGSFGTTNSTLTLPDRRVLFGISINGDVEFFDRHIREFASQRRFEVGVIQLPWVELAGGNSVAFSDCSTGFFDF
ncbi:MAG: hypothetical protein K8R59_13340 [Thermoanaerobaculales bacterium]|nr:hypothetical protein [Thermoanaerobaculales bacterium]